MSIDFKTHKGLNFSPPNIRLIKNKSNQMVTFAPYPIPVVTPLGDGYLIYVQSGEQFENDIWTCVLKDGGDIKHFNTSQLKIFKNATFNIYERKDS